MKNVFWHNDVASHMIKCMNKITRIKVGNDTMLAM